LLVAFSRDFDDRQAMSKVACLLSLFAAVWALQAHATKTVCTITVNSADEKDTFRSRLPKGDYQFVELVEKDRDDWLRSSCQKGVQCDVLVVSGHFNAGDTFYSDRIDVDEHLKVDELERASCSQSCPALFSRLKEVYLFGCESLNPDSTKYASVYGESGRDRMRRIFPNVPSIYGFSGPAPVGPTAAMLLNRYFDSGGRASMGTGQTNRKLLSVFSRNGMVRTNGVRDSEPQAAYRAQVCQFFDERKSVAQKLGYIHRLMRHDMGEARTFFVRIEKLFASLGDQDRQSPTFARALAEISADDATRDRYLAVTRGTREPGLRARMIALAGTLGWLSPEGQRSEIVAMVNDVLASNSMEFAEVDLICSLNKGGELDAELHRVKLPSSRANSAPQAAVLACLGSTEAHGQILRALASPDEKDVKIAQVYLRHRPIADQRELREVAKGVTRMTGSGAQVRALDTLGRLNISDGEILNDLARSFAEAKSVNVQRAIAEVFIRSDPKALPKRDLASLLRDHRLKSRDGSHDLIDVLISRLQAS
jgi:hypothetical protein